MTAQGHTQVNRNKSNCVKGLVGSLECVLFLEQLFKGKNILRLLERHLKEEEKRMKSV